MVIGLFEEDCLTQSAIETAEAILTDMGECGFNFQLVGNTREGCSTTSIKDAATQLISNSQANLTAII